MNTRSLSPGYLFVLSVPLVAGLAHFTEIRMGSIRLGGLLWMVCLVLGVVLIALEKAVHPNCKFDFPWRPWLAWFGLVWLSLAWGQHFTPRNVQDAVQITMPLMHGIAASLFIRTRAQLKTLLTLYGWIWAPLALAVALGSLGWLPSDGEMNLRPLALTAALFGCVFLAGYPPKLLRPALGWLVCLALATLTGSRMAAAVLLVIPIFHPILPSRWLRVGAIAAVLGCALLVFNLPIFQERFFDSGSGTLADVYEGEYLDFGRGDAWPLIFEDGMHRPLLGAGVGAAASYVPTIWPEMTHPHNDYLRVFYEEGLLGLLVYVPVCVWQLWDLWRRIGRTRNVVRVALVASWLGLLTFLITGATDNTMVYSQIFANPLFALMGAAYGVMAAQRKSSEPESANLESSRVCEFELASVPGASRWESSL